jgi:uroporphyrin-3 C-methyltransferase
MSNSKKSSSGKKASSEQKEPNLDTRNGHSTTGESEPKAKAHSSDNELGGAEANDANHLNDQETQHSSSETDSQTQETTSKDTQSTANHAHAGKGLKWVLMLLLLLVLATTSWVGYQQWLQKQFIDQQLSSQNTALDRQSAKLEQLQVRLEQQQEQLARLMEHNTNSQDQQNLLRQQLAATQEKLRLLSSKGRQEWVLEQAHYYLNLAQQKLLFEHNTTTAMALLAEADATLANSGDLNLTDLRQAIQNDLAVLAAVPAKDNHSLLLTLNALQQQVAHLTPQAIQLPETIDPPQAENKEWFDRLMATLDKFGEDAFKFRTHDNKVQPLLSDEHKAVLQVVLQLALTQAQTAVMKGDQSYYQSRLQFANEILTRYFQLNDQGAALSSQLLELQQASIEPPPAYSLTSLPLMEEIKQQRRLQWYSESSRPTQPDAEGDNP